MRPKSYSYIPCNTSGEPHGVVTPSLRIGEHGILHEGENLMPRTQRNEHVVHQPARPRRYRRLPGRPYAGPVSAVRSAGAEAAGTRSILSFLSLNRMVPALS